MPFDPLYHLHTERLLGMFDNIKTSMFKKLIERKERNHYKNVFSRFSSQHESSESTFL